MKTRTLTLVAMFIALGVLLPIAFHAVGAGKVMLPMHIPVLLGGYFLGPLPASFVGAVTPLLSAVLTGMPPFAPPMAQTMVFELAAYGLMVGYLRQVLKQGVYVSIIGGMLAGRLVYGFIGFLLLPLFGFDKIPFWAPITTSLVSSLPGVLIQVILLPPLARLLEGVIER